MRTMIDRLDSIIHFHTYDFDSCHVYCLLTTSLSLLIHGFSKQSTPYRNEPFAYPLLIALNACKKANPSRPCEMAKAQSEGDAIRDHEMSLSTVSSMPDVSGGGLPSLRHIFRNVEWSVDQLEPSCFGHLDILIHCVELWEQHSVFNGFDVILDLFRGEF